MTTEAITTLLVRFGIRLTERARGNESIPYGPLFHRWLPDGEVDSIDLETGYERATLRIWFERRGYVDGGGEITYDENRREIDPNLIPNQAILDAGLLSGELRLEGITEEQKISLLTYRYEKGSHDIEDENYQKLGAKVAWLIYQPVSRLLRIMKYIYGQYWLLELGRWGENYSLGAYCRGTLNAEWSLNGGQTWTPFVPTPQVLNWTCIITRTFDEYLTKDDWHNIGQLANDKYDPSLVFVFLSRANELSHGGDLRYALIQGVSALELAIGFLLETKLRKSSEGQAFKSKLRDLALPVKIILVATKCDRIREKDLDDVLTAIKVRNEIIHEGQPKTVTDEDELSTLSRKLIQAVRVLMGDSNVRLPSARPGNEIRIPDRGKPGEKTDSAGQ